MIIMRRMGRACLVTIMILGSEAFAKNRVPPPPPFTGGSIGAEHPSGAWFGPQGGMDEWWEGGSWPGGAYGGGGGNGGGSGSNGDDYSGWGGGWSGGGNGYGSSFGTCWLDYPRGAGPYTGKQNY